MDRRTFKRLIKELNRVIDLERKPIIESFLFRASPPVHFDITKDDIEKIVQENPGFSEFDVLKIVLEPILLNNPTNFSMLFASYDLLARTGKAYNYEFYFNYCKAAFKNLVLRSLEGLKDTGQTKFYIELLWDGHCCGKCEHLGGKIYPADTILNNMPIPIKECDREDYCHIGIISMTERRYLRKINENYTP